MPNVGALTVQLKADSSDLNRGLTSAQDKMRNLGGKFKKIGLGMSAAITAPIAGLAVFSIKTGRDFEASMNTVSAITNATGKDIENLTAKARELGGTTRFSASEAAEGMQFLGMAGFKTTEILESMAGVLNLAAASGIELGQAADITSNVLTGFRLEVEEVNRVNDVLAFSISNANTNLYEMGDAMSYLAPVAAAAGMDFEETAAAISLLGDQAIKGSRAGTSLSGAMTRLMAPTHMSTAIMRKFGLQMTDSEGNLVGFEEMIRKLNESGIDVANVMRLFGQRAGPSLLALMGEGSRAIGTMTEELKNAEGTTERMANVKMAGLDGAIITLSSTFQEFGISISKRINPALEGIVVKLTALIRWFGSLPKPVQDFILVFAGILAIIGPLLIAIGILIPALGLLSGAFATLNISLGVIAVAVLAIAGLIAAIVVIWKNWDEIVRFTKELFNTLVGIFMKLVEVIKEMWPGLKEWLIETWNDIWSNITDNPVVNFFKRVVDAVTGAMSSVIQVFKDIFEKIKSVFKFGEWIEELKRNWKESIYMEWLTGLKNGWENIWNGIKNFTKTLWNGIKNLYESKWGWILPGGALIKAFKFIKDNWETIWNSIKSFGSLVWGKISDIWDSIWNPIEKGWTLLWLGMKNTFETIWEGLKLYIGTTLDFIKGIWNTAWDGMVSVVKAIASPIISVINTIIGAINSLWGALNGVQIGWDKIALRGVPDIPAFGPWKPFNLPMLSTIPQLAQGGIVSKPTLAMIGESGREAVVPLGSRGGLGNTVVVNVYGPNYGFDDFDKKVSMAIRDGVRRGGFQGVIAR